MAASRFATFLETFDQDHYRRGKQWEHVCKMAFGLASHSWLFLYRHRSFVRSLTYFVERHFPRRVLPSACIYSSVIRGRPAHVGHHCPFLTLVGLASHSRARRWASVLCDQVHTDSVRYVMVSLVVTAYTAIIHCG